MTSDKSQTVNNRIVVVLPGDECFGKTGTVVSGPSERTLLRVLMDEPNKIGHQTYRYFLPCEIRNLNSLDVNQDPE